MEVAVNVNLNTVGFLLCSIFSSNLINCQQDQQNQCEVLQPTGWETGLDSSGVRTPTPLGLVQKDTQVTWQCPDSKINVADGKSSWVGTCVENSNTPGYTVFDYSWPGNTWPECECPPRVDTCTMDQAETPVSYNMRYTYSILSGGIPGVEITVPLPENLEIKFWSIKITWDIQTVERKVQIQSRTSGLRSERLDFPGFQHQIKPINSSFITKGPVLVDLGFNFLTDAIKLDTKKWHYPCITRIDCSITTEPTTDYLAVAAMMGTSIAIVFLIGLCCASCVWCMKNDGNYSSASRLVSAYSIRTVYDKKEMQKVRPYSAESDE